MELARQRLRDADATPRRRPQVHRREAPADRSGMKCSGEQDVVLWPLTLTDQPGVAAIETALLTLSGGFFDLSAAAGPTGPNRYVVVTVGCRTDAVVLRQLLGRTCRYLGVMGSVAKVAELRQGPAEAGFSAAALAQRRGPIGLPIRSQTPAEIAISIAAGLTRARPESAGWRSPESPARHLQTGGVCPNRWSLIGR